MDMEQRVEQRANAIYGLAWPTDPKEAWDRYTSDHVRVAYRRIARAELERERVLLAAVDDGIGIVDAGAEHHDSIWAVKIRLQQHRDRIRAAYEAEFAPPKRTVEQIARDVVAAWECASASHRQHALMTELAAALSAGRE